ncbi:NADH-quinone oxidoreductase subunit C [Flavobacterium sp. HXWNR69]|uniref:NADH-quinone oxidoreductase subunit C n=1 Tax=Flavobacterium fragile TaxID=2949085 RepID=A0ABT0TF64_9FLAO|nr:NADH-quinone oxidoreductase subunit C [Flavobacterium sp. HXWNR69]MCL9769625.1 NADH-quinone oxidoreductase subunit C [Flavobacterium sp. HXWNR69]
MAIETAYIQEKMQQKFADKVSNFEMQNDIFSFEVTSDSVREVILFLKEEEDTNFHFLTDLCGVHYPDNEESRQFCVVYHLHNWVENTRIRVKTYLNGTQPEVATISDVFLSSNWMERETYDFYGIKFIGHPQLKRILNMDEMVSFPLRKEFPMEDNGRTDKDDRFFGRTANC